MRRFKLVLCQMRRKGLAVTLLSDDHSRKYARDQRKTFALNAILGAKKNKVFFPDDDHMLSYGI